MILDGEIKRLIHQAGSETDIRMYLAQTGWKTLRHKALEIVERGQSTLEEVIRVTRSEVSVGSPMGEGVEAVL